MHTDRRHPVARGAQPVRLDVVVYEALDLLVEEREGDEVAHLVDDDGRRRRGGDGVPTKRVGTVRGGVLRPPRTTQGLRI